MSYGAIESNRLAAQSGILARFAEGFAKAEKALADRQQDPKLRALTAARIALEYSVLQTAIEKQVPPQQVAQALEGTTIEQQARLIKEGRAAMERAYRVSPDVVVGAMAGKMVDVPLPKGFARNPEFDKVIDSARNLVTAIVQDTYENRGRFEGAGDRERGGYVTVANDSQRQQLKTDLASRLAFIEAAIDAGVGRGAMPGVDADMLKARIEREVFMPRPPQSLQYTEEFRKFYERRGADMQIDVMKEVRAVTRSKTVTEIAAKIDESLRQPTIDQGRRIDALER